MTSVQIPSNQISRWLQDATRFLEKLDDLLPGRPAQWFDLLPFD